MTHAHFDGRLLPPKSGPRAPNKLAVIERVILPQFLQTESGDFLKGWGGRFKVKCAPDAPLPDIIFLRMMYGADSAHLLHPRLYIHH